MNKEYYKCLFKTKNKNIGSVRGHFKDKDEVINYVKNGLKDRFGEIISIFSNKEVSEIAKKVKDEIKKTIPIKYSSLIRYRSYEQTKLIGLDFLSIDLDSRCDPKMMKKFENLNIVKKHNTRFPSGIKKDIPYLHILISSDWHNEQIKLKELKK